MALDRKLDTASLIALFSIFLGWFFIDTLAVTLGSLRHGVKFVDLPVVIIEPARMFLGIDRTMRTYLFGTLCLLCLLLPWSVYLRTDRWVWFAHAAPLTLMLVCAVLLYAKTAGEFLPAPSDPNSLGGNLVRLTNGLVHRGGGVVARHIVVGVGGYLAFLGSVVLALAGLRGYLRQKPHAT